MPLIVAPVSSTETPITAGDVIACAQREIQDSFSNAGTTLLGYIDRVQRDIIRRRPMGWDWMQSGVEQFVTRIGQTKYWVGPTASVSTGQVDTGLNLSDVRSINASSVLDRTGFTDLAQFGEAPLAPGEENRDTTYLLDQPRWFRTDESTPNLIEIFPSPMKAPDYHIVPLPPYVTTTTSGALADRTYYVKVTFVDDQGGESVGPQKATQFTVPANEVLVVKPPQPGVSESGTGVAYTQYNVYVSETEGSEELQSTSPVDIDTDWQEPNTGLISGVAVPSSPTISPLNGFIIQFRYVRKITRVTSTDDELLIPERYLDVICSGVIALGAQYNSNGARLDKKAADWGAIYERGIVGMTRDQNPYPGTELFIRPDVQTHLYRIR